MPTCPHCLATFDHGGCASCRGRWLTGPELEVLAPGKLAAWRRLVGKGPLANGRCADCGGALKSLDIAGHAHEGDLFWGLESARPPGTAVVAACPRCGGVWVDARDVDRAGGIGALKRNLRETILGAS